MAYLAEVSRSPVRPPSQRKHDLLVIDETDGLHAIPRRVLFCVGVNNDVSAQEIAVCKHEL